MSENTPLLSIIVPALNEQDNVGPLVMQVKQAVIDVGIQAELIVIDDGSTDATLSRLRPLCAEHPWLRILRREQPMGQSAAMAAGIQAARGSFIAMLDADLQNDPADLPAMLEILKNDNADLVQGDRSANRHDNFVRRFSSWVGCTARRLLLGDTTRDTGCTTRILRTEIASQLPLQYKGMHRFIPAFSRLIGARIVEQPVNHRHRHTGEAKYGILNRGPAGLIDCFAMRWMIKRHRNTEVVEIDRS
jgi:glycosyltransferase involved in cell wall biosynthesis